MSKHHEVMKLALEALKRMKRFGNTGYRSHEQDPYRQVCEAITALEALAEQQEPVAQYIGESCEGSLVQLYDDVKKGTDFYTSPQAQRTWVGLTDEEVLESWNEIRDGDWAPDFYAAIEAALRSKNT